MAAEAEAAEEEKIQRGVFMFSQTSSSQRKYKKNFQTAPFLELQVTHKLDKTYKFQTCFT